MKYRRFGRTELPMPVISCGGMRYNLLGQGDHWFPGADAAQAGQSTLANALQRSPFAGTIPGILREAHELFHQAPRRRLSQS